MKKDVFAKVTAVLFVLAFLALLVTGVQAALRHGDSVKAAMEAPRDPGATIVTQYSDFFISHISGIELPENGREAAEAWFAEQMPPSVSLYGSFIFTEAAVFTLLAFLLLEYFLFARNENSNFKHGLSVLFVCAAAFAIYAGTVFTALVVKDYPTEWAFGKLDKILCSFLAMLASALAAAKLIRRARHPRLTAILCIPVGIILFYASLICEGIAADAEGNISQALKLLFGAEELLNPVAGIALCLTSPDMPAGEVRLYMIKSCAVILLFFLLWRKSRRGRDRKTGKKLVAA